jgi:hypothetical protein
MPIQKFPSMKAAGEKRLLNVRKDPPDIRDRMYEPALIQLQPLPTAAGGYAEKALYRPTPRTGSLQPDRPAGKRR